MRLIPPFTVRGNGQSIHIGEIGIMVRITNLYNATIVRFCVRMKRLSLRTRVYGDQFASFERDIIWDRKHAGWVKFIGENRFILIKSPFSGQSSAFCYIAPDDLDIKEGQLLELEVGPLERYGTKKDPKTGMMVPALEYYYVEAFHDIKVNLKKPFSAKEFKERLTYNWVGANQDNLGDAIALQMLSCPSDIYGPGGIGGQTLNVSSSKKPLDDLKRTISQFLPLEFTKRNKKYEFDFIKGTQDAVALCKRRNAGRVEESSYNFLKIVDPNSNPLPIQVPTIIQNACYCKKYEGFDPEVLDFFLTSLMLHPRIGEESINMIEANLRFVMEEIEPEYSGQYLPIDRFAITRLAMSECRLNDEKTLDESSFDRSKGAFTQLYREFLDLKSDVFLPGKDSYAIPNTRVSYAYANLGQNDIEVLKRIFRLVRERGESWLQVQLLFDSQIKPRMTQGQLRESIERLNNSGRIIQKENGAFVRPLKVG